MKIAMGALAALVIGAIVAPSPLGVLSQTENPAGRIVDDVRCAEDATQGYALYVPTTFTRDRERGWPLIIALHPGARGRAIVEKFQAGAERFGYILAGSNNSRNGPMQPSLAAVQAMLTDLGRRFPIDPKRIYFAGHSGGARVGMHIAVSSPPGRVAGVIASSAGFSDGQPRTSASFAVFGTAGTEDFNNLEMRKLDRMLTTPHRVVVFEGGHTLPPDNVAMQALEWMDLHAMRTGLRPRDEAVVGQLYQARTASAAAVKDPATAARAFDAAATDFPGLTDVSDATARATVLMRSDVVKRAIKQEQDDVDREQRLIEDLLRLEAGLRVPDTRLDSLSEADRVLSGLARQANAAGDSVERRRARRVLRQISSGARERVSDSGYLQLLQKHTVRGATMAGPAWPGGEKW